MRYIVFFIVIVVISSCSFSGGAMLTNDKILEAHKAIELCVNEYGRLSDKAIPESIDRVYVLISSEKMDLLFAHGEVGTFGGRSADYKSFFSCGVLSAESPELYFLGEPLKDPLVLKPNVPQITESGSAETLWDLLFLKDGSEFEFSEGKIFSTDDIEVLKGPTLD